MHDQGCAIFQGSSLIILCTLFESSIVFGHCFDRGYGQLLYLFELILFRLFGELNVRGSYRYKQSFDAARHVFWELGDSVSSQISGVFDLSCHDESSDDGYAEVKKSWHLVGVRLLFSLVSSVSVSICVLLLAILLAFGLDEFGSLSMQFLVRRTSIRQIYFWPPSQATERLRHFLRFCCLCLGGLLECAAEDPMYEEAFGGVQILQCLFRALFVIYGILELCRYLRFREESFPKFPAACKFRARVRCCRKKRSTLTRRKSVAILLLLNLATSEAVGIFSDTRSVSFADLTGSMPDDRQNRHESSPSTTVDATCNTTFAILGSQDSGRTCPVLSIGNHSTNDWNSLPCVPFCGNQTLPGAPFGYHTYTGAVQGFCPHFGADHDNHVSSYTSGDMTYLSTPIALSGWAWNDDSVVDQQDSWTALVWFAAALPCQSEARQKRYHSGAFVLHRNDFNHLWADRCQMLCDYTIVRPQPPASDFLVGPSVTHFLVFRPEQSNFRATLVRMNPKHGSQNGYLSAYEACLLRQVRSRGLRDLQASKSLPGEFRPENLVSSPLLFEQGELLLLPGSDLGTDSVGVRALDDDIGSLMQVGPPAEDAVARHIRVSVPNHRAARIMVWFHPLDARGSASRRFRFEDYNHELPAGPQVRSFWANLVGRRQCFIYPVIPVPPSIPERHPHFILTTFQVSTIYPALLDYVSDTESFRATFLFYFLGYPDVNGLFVQAIPMNQCVWLTACTVHMETVNGVQIFRWGQIVPLFRGAFLTLHEHDLHDDSSSSTCSSNHAGTLGDSSSEDSFRPGHFEEPEALIREELTTLMQNSLSMRGNTATLIGQTDESLRFFKDGVLASYALLHYEDALAEYVYKTTGRSWILHRSVQSWVVTYVHQLGYVPRFCVPAQDFSLTRCLLDTWYDVTHGEDVGFSRELRGALTWKDDMVFNVLGASLSKLRLGYRVYLITGWPDPIPSTVALLCSGEEDVRQLILRIGYSERCKDKRCFLFQDRGGLNPVWDIGDVVDEDHGSSFSLLYEPRNVCTDEVVAASWKITRQSYASREGDGFFGMQLPWESAFAAEDPELHTRLGLQPATIANPLSWPRNGQV